MREKVAICGAATQLGQHFTKMLRDYNFEPIFISLDDLKLPAPMLAEKLSGCYAVCNMSGVPYMAKWTDRYEHNIYCSRMLAIRSLVNAIVYCAEKPQVFVTLSNAMGYDAYDVNTDFSPTKGDSFVSDVARVETKEALALMRKAPEVRLVIVRSGFIMGRSKGPFPILRRLSRMGLCGVVGDGYQCVPVVHIDDASRALFRLTTDTSCSGIYNLTIPQMMSLRELSEAMQEHTNHRQLPMPKWFIRLVAGKATGLLEQNCKVVPERLEQMGFVFSYPTISDIVKNLIGE